MSNCDPKCTISFLIIVIKLKAVSSIIVFVCNNLLTLFILDNVSNYTVKRNKNGIVCNASNKLWGSITTALSVLVSISCSRALQVCSNKSLTGFSTESSLASQRVLHNDKT